MVTFGDEAQLVINAGYTDGDVTLAAKGTDQDEMEVSVYFAFLFSEYVILYGGGLWAAPFMFNINPCPFTK